MSYVCDQCGDVFDEPEHIIERHGFLTPPYEKIPVSPCCAADFSNGAECAECGRVVSEDNIEYGLCGSCRAEVKTAFKEFIGKFSTDERLVLDDWIELVGGLSYL